MGLFDGKSNIPTTVLGMAQGFGDNLGRKALDPIMENFGYESEESRILEVVKGADMSNSESFTKTFQALLEISPEAANEFKTQGMPILEANLKQQKLNQPSKSNDPGTFRKSLNTASLILGCDLTDTKCRKESYAMVLDYKRENAWDKGSADALIDDMVLIQQAGSDANLNIKKFTQLSEILPQIYTGFGAGVVQNVNRIGAMFGLKPATEAAGQAEIFAQGGMSIALDYIKLTKGAISDREFETFLTMAPGLARTQLGNKLMLDTAMQYARYNENKAKEQSRWIKEKRASGQAPLLEDWSAHLIEWSNRKENIIKLPTDAQYEEAKQSVKIGDPNNTNANRQERTDEIVARAEEAKRNKNEH